VVSACRYRMGRHNPSRHKPNRSGRSKLLSRSGKSRKGDVAWRGVGIPSQAQSAASIKPPARGLTIECGLVSVARRRAAAVDHVDIRVAYPDKPPDQDRLADGLVSASNHARASVVKACRRSGRLRQAPPAIGTSPHSDAIVDAPDAEVGQAERCEIPRQEPHPRLRRRHFAPMQAAQRPFARPLRIAQAARDAAATSA